jgi:hypothetical protein
MVSDMGANNDGEWTELRRLLSEFSGACPREIRAWAMALTILGYSSRHIERQLKELFPGTKMPNFATIARWQRSRPASLGAYLRWSDVAERAAVILDERLDEMHRLPVNKMFTVAVEATEALEIGREGWVRTRERRNQRRKASRDRRVVSDSYT